MKEIPLTKGKVAYISDIDYPEVRKYKWHCNNRYAQRGSRGKRIYLHRFIAILKGIGDAEQIDHIDGDASNCTRSNLRAATNQQNQMNCNVTWAKSGIRGVYLNRHGRWQARLGLNGKQIGLGAYDTIEEATEARRKGELKYYGRFASKDTP